MKVFTVNGTQVRVHPLALLLALLVIGMGEGVSLMAGLMALLLHELAHVLAAKAFRLPVPQVEITPFGGVARMEDLSQASPVQQFVIAFAGPMMSWLCCLCCAGLIQLGWVMGADLRDFLRWNVLLLCFNLLPVLPLDGGRMLQAVLAPIMGWEKAMRLLSTAGILMGLALNGLAIWGAFQGVANLSLVLAGCYLMYAAQISRTMAATQVIHGMISKKLKLEREKTVRVEWLGAARSVSVSDLMRRLSPGTYHRVVVLDEDGLASIGELDDSVLVNAMLDQPRQSVGDLLERMKG